MPESALQSRNFCRAILLSALPLAFSAYCVSAAELVHAKDGSGVCGYKDTPKLPWCEWLVHDSDRPAPKRVEPGPAGAPVPAPADAIVLFDGSDVSKWKDIGDWKIEDGCLIAGNKPFLTKADFGKTQFHIEWQGPADFKTTWDNRGNNGVLLMGLYEIQIFDSYNEKLYPDGQCAAIYGQTPPLVNVTRPPGQWQTYDIIFTPPKFDGAKLTEPARVTMFHNGVLVHLEEPIHGETGHRIVPQYTHKVSSGRLGFGGHNCPVRFRNVWARPL